MERTREAPQITVFTPAYNRAHTLHRVYESLKSQTFRAFEWIVVDDGSTDGTEAVVQGFQARDPGFPIRYFYQENQGKHMATNRAVREARGAFFITLDSDDGCVPHALERLLRMWETIPAEQRPAYKGVSCRCCKPERPGVILGTPLPCQGPYLDSHDLELRCRYHVRGELWGMTRREVLAETPYPAIAGLHYYPEGVYWGRIGLRYQTRYFDEPLRIYYTDGTAQDGQLTKRVHADETYYARAFMMSPEVLRRYFRDRPWNFYLQAVGLVRDGLLTGRPLSALYQAVSGSGCGPVLLTLALLPGKALEGLERVRRSRRRP